MSSVEQTWDDSNRFSLDSFLKYVLNKNKVQQLCEHYFILHDFKINSSKYQ